MSLLPNVEGHGEDIIEVDIGDTLGELDISHRLNIKIFHSIYANVNLIL